MFRIKNVRIATVAKKSAIPNAFDQFSPLQPMRQAEKPKPQQEKVNAARITRGDWSSKKDLGKKPKVPRGVVLRERTEMLINANITKPVTKIAKIMQHKEMEKIQKKEEHHLIQAIPTPIVHEQTVKIEQKIPEIARQINILKQQQIKEQQAKERQVSEEKQNQEQQRRKRRKQYLREKQIREKQQQQKNAETLKLMMEKVNARRKAREEQRERQLLETQQQAPSLAGIISLSDPLAHVEMSQAVMDKQVNLIISKNFAGYPNQQALKRQVEELERINTSYLLVRTEPGNRLIKGLANLRVELFNRVGELIMQVKASLGPTASRLHVMQSDSRNLPQIEGMQVTRGMEGHIQSVLSKALIKSAQQCAICLGIVQKGELVYEVTCRHIFHPMCLQEWLSTNANCPSCRYNIKFGQR